MICQGARGGFWILSRLRYELVLSWRFNVVDLTAAVVPGLLFSVSAWRCLGLPVAELPWALVRGLAYFWLFLSVHTLSNQIAGVEEDRLNKPYRPIPTGLVSVRGASHRLVVSIMLFLGAGQLFGVLGWTVLWVVMVGVRMYDDLIRFWFVKNPAIVVGALALLGAGWQMNGPMTTSGRSWVIAGTCYWLIGFMEDLRDQAGDRQVGRRTLPIVIGDPAVRTVSGIALLSLPFLALAVLRTDALHSPGAVWFGVLSASSWAVAARCWLLRNARSDALTYQLYCCTWCWLIAGPIFVTNRG